MKKSILIMISFCILMFISCSSPKKSENIPKTTEVVCDTSVYPLVSELVENYNANSKHKIELKILSKDQISSLNNDSNIIVSYENKYLKKYSKDLLCTDGVAIVVNKRNKIQNIKLEDLGNIYLGQINNWKELTNMNKELKVIIYEGVDEVLEKHIEKKSQLPSKENIKGDIFYTKNINDVKKVDQEENVLAVIPMMYLKKDSKTVKLNGIEINVNNIKNGLYTMVMPIYMYHSDKIDSFSNDFIRYVNSDNGKKIIKKYCLEANS